MENAAAVILLRPDGAIVLRHIDVPAHLNGEQHIAAFGGRRHHDESPRLAAWRNLLDQTELELVPEQLVFWRRYTRTLPATGLDLAVHYFIAPPISMEHFESRPGYAVVHNTNEATRLNLTPLTRRALNDYFCEQRRHRALRRRV